MENTKICGRCGRELPLECFSKDKTKKDGLQTYCKECHKQWRADNADARKQYMKQWYAEHRDERKQHKKQYRATIEGYARVVRHNNLQEDRNHGRIRADEDPLPSIEQYIELLQQRDYYDKKHYPFNEMGVDRIDNSKAHTIDNVVPCTTEHNRQRGRKDFEDFCERMQNSF